MVELIEKENEKVVIVDNLHNSSIKCLDRLRDITGADEETLIYIEMDICDKKDLEKKVFEKYSIKSVIHFAGLKAVGESVKKPLFYYHNNVAGTISLL